MKYNGDNWYDIYKYCGNLLTVLQIVDKYLLISPLYDKNELVLRPGDSILIEGRHLIKL